MKSVTTKDVSRIKDEIREAIAFIIDENLTQGCDLVTMVNEAVDELIETVCAGHEDFMETFDDKKNWGFGIGINFNKDVVMWIKYKTKKGYVRYTDIVIIDRGTD